jgi:AcrR family transcriptional regulator
MATEKAESHSKSSDEPRKARQVILAAARRVQMRDGVAGLNIVAVAKEAGVTSDAVTGHFQNAQEMLVAIAADDLASLARLDQDESDKQPSPKNEVQPAKSEAQPAKSDGQASKIHAHNQPRENFRKKALLPAPLEQVMREVVPDPEKDAILTGAMTRL